MKNIKSFNKMHSFFNSKISELYETKEGKKIIAGYIKLIKENKVLLKQYDLYNLLESGVSSIIKESRENSSEYLNEILNSFNGITIEDFYNANKKLYAYLNENKVINEWEMPWGRKNREREESAKNSMEQTRLRNNHIQAVKNYVARALEKIGVRNAAVYAGSNGSGEYDFFHHENEFNVRFTNGFVSSSMRANVFNPTLSDNEDTTDLQEIVRKLEEDPNIRISAVSDKGFSGSVTHLTRKEMVGRDVWDKDLAAQAKRDGKFEEREIIKLDPLFESMDYILLKGKSDLSQYIEHKNTVINELRLNEKSTINEEKSTEDWVKEFNEKYSGKLTVEEMNLVKDLIKVETPRPEVLREYQKSVISTINDLITITEDVELKGKYLTLKERVLFEDSSDIEKICKLFEIRDVIEEIKSNK